VREAEQAMQDGGQVNPLIENTLRRILEHYFNILGSTDYTKIWFDAIKIWFNTMKIWFDTEFIEDGRTIDLMSIGMVREDGKVYYAESEQCDLSRADEWVQQNVIPHLQGTKTPRSIIAHDIIEFAGSEPEFWAYYADYDWVVLCQLYGRMIDLPEGWPMFCRDLQQLRIETGIEPPPQFGVKHNALDDAIWTRYAYLHILQHINKGEDDEN